MGQSGLHELDAVAQAAAVRGGEISPVELVEHHLDRIARYDAQLGAFLTVTAESARDQASSAEQRLTHGDLDALPPLFGVPTAIKDLSATTDVRTTFGSKAFEEFVPQREAHAVRLLREAGTISLGKTNTPEFGLSGYTDNDLVGPARSPWDTARTAGGSSGGAAAAVAAGLVPFAHGSDGGGSIRIPAACCGIFGLKPSRGRISNGPVGSDVTGFTIQGPLSWTVRDAAAMLDALAHPQPGDPYWAPPLPDGESFLQYAGRDPGRLRIGVYTDPGLDELAVDPEIMAAHTAAAELLASLGHEVVEIPNPFGDTLRDSFLGIWATQSLLMKTASEEQLRPLSKWWREIGRGLSAEQFLDAMTGTQLGSRRAVEAMDAFDAVLTPTLAVHPPAPEWFQEGDALLEAQRQTGLSCFTAAFNASGQPAASLPLGQSADGVPIGVMLAGRPAGEAALISLCAQIEAAQPWAHRRPPLFA
ncbi:amidase [Streptomyces indicus]|uniref:Amidase n=1 Tax=Streptomyces indicus TaxID=417292 RepID=A0A1G8YJ17_9ACTN|nr:amidase [Streptomyces indicus]SDK02090.1 amidase [Streptomyces indicus]